MQQQLQLLPSVQLPSPKHQLPQQEQQLHQHPAHGHPAQHGVSRSHEFGATAPAGVHSGQLPSEASPRAVASSGSRRPGISNAAKQYAAEVLDPVLEDLFSEILRVMPPDPLQFMEHWLAGQDRGTLRAPKSAKKETQANAVVRQYPFLRRVLKDLVEQVLHTLPPDIVKFMMLWLAKRRAR